MLLAKQSVTAEENEEKLLKAIYAPDKLNSRRYAVSVAASVNFTGANFAPAEPTQQRKKGAISVKEWPKGAAKAANCANPTTRAGEQSRAAKDRNYGNKDARGEP